ncbi:hypothetical protein DPEC_G00112270 [Dallia pectoralis]|uniref:Uncharacterized protein n=1 Tax=Dallia pectoralis TaxID=75939 RepID=A0ACC2GU40_DALPE|nr:hypothetical protein DPEC_G00112270 [Dallia pectoralis]
MEKFIIRYPKGRARAGEDERPTGQTTDMTTDDEQRTTVQNNGTTRVFVTWQPGETEERQGQVSDHSTQNLQGHNVGVSIPSDTNNVSDDEQHQERQASQETGQQVRAIEGEEKRKKLVLWPTAAARKDWESFDGEMDQVVESVLAGDIGRKIKAMSTIIWNMGVERFGTEQRQIKGPQQVGENRRSGEIAKLRGDLRRLRKAFRQAPDDEKPSLKEMRDNIRERIKILRRTECQRRDRRRREEEQKTPSSTYQGSSE